MDVYEGCIRYSKRSVVWIALIPAKVCFLMPRKTHKIEYGRAEVARFNITIKTFAWLFLLLFYRHPLPLPSFPKFLAPSSSPPFSKRPKACET